MIPALVFFALVLWLGMKAIARGGGWATAFLLVGLLLFIPAFTLILILPLPLALFMFLLVPLCCRSMLTSPRARSLAVTASVVGAGCITGWMTWEDQRQLADYRKEFPFQAVNERLVKPRAAGALTNEVESRLDDIERLLDKNVGFAFRPSLNVRSYVLKQLHEEAVRTFVSSPGFGRGRLDVRPNSYFLNFRLRTKPFIEQRHSQWLSAGALENDQWEPLQTAEDLDALHREAVVDFVNPTGFGYVRDRRHVAGFQSHQFGEMPLGRQMIATIELVGLLLHPEPVVYVSPHLPNMEELRGAPTRALDRFEEAGLEAIQKGKDLFVGQTPTGTRMVGAIRSAKQCLQCHEGNRGDLLGAFSYRLEGNGK